MSDATSVLFGLEHEFSVLEVRRVDAITVKVIIEQAAREGPCPECGVFSGTVKDRPVMRLKDLPAFGQTVELWRRKRRLTCSEALCLRKTFTQVSAAVRPRARITERLRRRVARAIASGNRAVSLVWSPGVAVILLTVWFHALNPRLRERGGRTPQQKGGHRCKLSTILDCTVCPNDSRFQPITKDLRRLREMATFALSRRQHGFESRWGYKIEPALTRLDTVTSQPACRLALHSGTREGGRKNSQTAAFDKDPQPPTCFPR